MDPERTKLTAPERIYLGYTSFWYETSEEGLHDIEYVRADLLATASEGDGEIAHDIAEKFIDADSFGTKLARENLTAMIAKALTTAHKEGRKAAFRDH